MDDFLKITAGVLVAVLLGIGVKRQNGDIALVLAVAVCAMVVMAAAEYFTPVVAFLRDLSSSGQLDGEMMGILMKAVGIGLVSEIAALLCADAGNAALGKGLQILSSAVILALAVPLMTRVLELVERILGEA